jgi:hypothetical protein
VPHPKVKLSDDSGNTVDVTGNALDVNIAGGTSIEIGNVDIQLDGTSVSPGADTMDNGTIRIALATDDTQFGVIGADADVDGNIHGQLRYIGNALASQSTIASNTGGAKDILNFTASTTGAQYAEGDGGFIATGVRNDDLASLVSVDHDHAPFQVNALGALYTTGGEIENAAVQSEPLLIGGRYDSSARTLNTGDAGAIALNASGHVLTAISDGTEILGHGTVAHTTMNVTDSAVALPIADIKHADIMATLANTGIVYIGASGVDATTGIALYPGDVYSVDIESLQLLYAISTVSGDDLNIVIYY